LAGIRRSASRSGAGLSGYPGNGVYLEFHKKHNERGLRYWKVTNNKAGLGDKDRIIRTTSRPKVYEHCPTFLDVSARRARGAHRDRDGRAGVCVAPFVCRLFGTGGSRVRDCSARCRSPRLPTIRASELLTGDRKPFIIIRRIGHAPSRRGPGARRETTSVWSQ